MTIPPPASPILPPPPHRKSPPPGAPRIVALGSLASGVLAAVLLPGSPVGLGLLLVALAITASVALSRPRRISAEVVVSACLGLALAAMSVLRDAEWILGFDALYALGLAALVVVGGSTWSQVARAPLVVLARVHRAVPFLWRGLRPGRVPGAGRLSPALRGAALGGALLLVFGGLFASADRAFAHLASEILVPEWDHLDLLAARVLVFAVVAVAVGAYVAASPRFAALGTPWPMRADLWSAVLQDEERGSRRLGRTEWAIALGLLDMLFAAFVVLQIAVLFGGHDHVLRTAGLTYAEYARQGFFQLLAVGALTLAVVAAAMRWATRGARRDTLLLQVLLGALCALTLVILASALRRLGLYEEAFGFTRARIAAHAIILWLGGLLVLVMVAGVRMRGWWLPRAAVAFTAVALLVFTLVNPDRLVASKNVERYRETGQIDLEYLSRLSADAVPALATTLPSPLRACVLFAPGGAADDLARPEPWHAWNLSRSEARSVLDWVRAAGPVTCPSDLPVRP
jgi:hypothetical protein